MGIPLGGIVPFPTLAATRDHAVGFLATAAEVIPAVNKTPPLGSLPEWQLAQYLVTRGATSFSKVGVADWGALATGFFWARICVGKTSTPPRKLAPAINPIHVLFAVPIFSFYGRYLAPTQLSDKTPTNRDDLSKK
jgi:hypothetical protein